MNIVLPIAGLGQRFKNGGYETPKPLIKMDGEYMIERAMKSVDYSNSKLFFIVRQEHIEQYKIDSILKEKFGDDIHVESIGYTTDGALSTCLLVEEHIDNDEPLIIFTPDCYFEPKFVAPTENKIDGMVVTFNSDSNAHSYVKISDETSVKNKSVRDFNEDKNTDDPFNKSREGNNKSWYYKESLIDKVLGNHNADLFIHTWEIDEEFTDDKWGVNDDGVYTDEGATDADKDRQIVDDTLNVIDNLK